MFKRFLDGLFFGAGFAISCFVVWWLSSALLLNTGAGESNWQELPDAAPKVSTEQRAPEIPFHELSIEERIERSSAIALADFVQGEDGRMEAIIREFLKIEPGTVVHYDVGDEFESASYYPEPDVHYGDGVIIFFVDSPAQFRMSMTYSGDRIRSLGDMPLKLFREKCASSAEQTD